MKNVKIILTYYIMLKNISLKINSLFNVYRIDKAPFIPNHKYSFIYNNNYYIGFFIKVLEKGDKQIYLFNNFSIETNMNEPSFIFDFQHHILSPNVARLLQQETFSYNDNASDRFEKSVMSSNYKKILEKQNKDNYDDYMNVDINDFEFGE